MNPYIADSQMDLISIPDCSDEELPNLPEGEETGKDREIDELYLKIEDLREDLYDTQHDLQEANAFIRWMHLSHMYHCFYREQQDDPDFNLDVFAGVWNDDEGW